MNKDARILIVDDDPRVLLILSTALKRMKNGYRVVAVPSGAEALQEVTAEPFDLVITDVRMPGIDGIELVETIRDLNLSTMVIWITAYGCNQLQVQRKRLGVFSCLDKPLRIDEIRQAALEALEAIWAQKEQTDGRQ